MTRSATRSPAVPVPLAAAGSDARGHQAAATPVTLLLTKFNVRLAGAVGPSRGVDPGWLEDRMALFERWTLESVRRQAVRPHQWLVFVDADTGPAQMELLGELCAGTATLIPVAGVLTDARIGLIVDEHLPAGRFPLVTARLDNDDAIAARYLQTMAAQATGWRGFVNPRNGVQLAGSRLLRCWDRSSPFLAMIEERDPTRPPATVFCTEHHRAESVAPVRQLGGRPLWLQVVHGGNLGNQARGIPYPWRTAERALGWPLPHRHEDGGRVRVGVAARSQLAAELRWGLRRLPRR